MILQWIQIDYQKVQTKLEVQKILKEGFHRGGDMLGKSWKIDGQRSGLHAIPSIEVGANRIRIIIWMDHKLYKVH